MLDIEKIKKRTMAKLKSHFAKKFDAIESLACPEHGEHPKIIIPKTGETTYQIQSCCKTLREMATAKRKEIGN